MAAGQVLHGLAFYPRGGSAQVVRYLAIAQRNAGCLPLVVAGSLGRPGDLGHAPTFFRGLPVVSADFGPAVRAWEHGHDPMAEPVPIHPSYEDRPNVPDRIFAAVSPALAEHQVRAWDRVLARTAPYRPSILHLHHLTPLHEAATQRWPDIPAVTHLHGTELLMMERIENSRRDRKRSLPASWRYAGYWLARLRAVARRSDHILALTPEHAERARAVLGVPADRVSIVPNGVDTDLFHPIRLDRSERLRLLRRWLVDDPQGWDTSGRPGTIRYSQADLGAFVHAGSPRPVLLFVGRFTAVKRLPLLLRAYARVTQRLGPIAPLLVWGGYPGEWEGRHPCELGGRQEGVFFVGWRGHDELPLGFACADLLVVPSVGEAFGSVYLEAMAAGLPVVACQGGGPEGFINADRARPLGWLVPPDDEFALAEALVEALIHPLMRQARGAAALALVRKRFSWANVSTAVSHVYSAVAK